MERFEEAYERFLHEQRSSAKGSRSERLEKVGAGEKLLLKEAIWPLFKSFEGFYLEYEILGVNGIKLYLDVFYKPLGIVSECDGFVVHAETITRDRFMFERMRIRSMAMQGLIYVPFSYDELDKKPDACRSSMYELLGRLGASPAADLMILSVQERELLRYVRTLDRAFNLKDVAQCLQQSPVTNRKYISQLVNKMLLRPKDANMQRHHYYELTDHARELFRTGR